MLFTLSMSSNKAKAGVYIFAPLNSVVDLEPRVRVFLGLPDPSLFCTDPVPDPDPSINKPKKVRKTLISTILRLLFDFYLRKLM
jgi:hypothetical protein